eukprot:XP_025985039.1 putative protein TPRXL isoform X4 [Glycine max]
MTPRRFEMTMTIRTARTTTSFHSRRSSLPPTPTMATTSLCHASAPTRASLHSTFAPICLSSSSLSLTSTASSGASATSTMARHATTSSPSAGASLSIIRSSSPATLSFSSRTPTMEWSRPTQLGEIPSPRAGHAGVTVGENWFIVSGGDNKSGVSETIVLNMSTLTWSVVTSVQGRVPVASEELLTRHKSIVAEFLSKNYEWVQDTFACDSIKLLLVVI